MADDDEGSLYTSIGIAIAITGNVLISLALNLQKVAHNRLHHAKSSANPSPTLSRQPSNTHIDVVHHQYTESRPLLPRSVQSYGSIKSKKFWTLPKITILQKPRPQSVAALLSPQAANGELGDGDDDDDDDDDDELHEARGTESDYLRSKLWWLGFCLMNVGEIGNFLSYAYAPASLVAPLGTVALVANCFFAPLMLHERFRKRDFVGIVLAVIGSITVVLSSKPVDVRLDEGALVQAICQPIFIAYTVLTVLAIVFLTLLSTGNAGRDWIFVDVGICALFGGYTVLATKALSTLISLELYQVYKLWITYPLVVILLATGIGQIRYLNRALMKFDSKHVIPTQFVMFNLTAIIGSAILYRDFEDITLHKMISFVYGILTVFLAIFILTYAPPPPSDGDGVDGGGGGGDGVGGGTPLLPLDLNLDDPMSITSPITPSADLSTTSNLTAVPIAGPSANNKQVLRTKPSTAKLGLSPGQYLLLAASPPTTTADPAPRSARERDLERAGPDGGGEVGSVRARRGRSVALDIDEQRSRSAEAGRRRTIHFDVDLPGR